MAGETKLTVIGNLTADPELRYTQNGAAVANFTVASTPRVFDRQANEFKDGEALFMRCAVWRDMADHVASSLSKGARVIVVGDLKQRSYQDKEGNNRVSIELDVEAVGPDLRYATAQVTRAQANGQQAQGQPQQQGNYGPPQGQQAPNYGPPQGGQPQQQMQQQQPQGYPAPGQQPQQMQQQPQQQMPPQQQIQQPPQQQAPQPGTQQAAQQGVWQQPGQQPGFGGEPF